MTLYHLFMSWLIFNEVYLLCKLENLSHDD
jgi:hypothetical protein